MHRILYVYLPLSESQKIYHLTIFFKVYLRFLQIDCGWQNKINSLNATFHCLTL